MQAIDTLIGDIHPPAELMKTLTERKIAEEQKKTYEVQEAAQKQRQLLVRETATAEIQLEMVRRGAGRAHRRAGGGRAGPAGGR